jgi:DNA-binding IclR family transcriptional regulator
MGSPLQPSATATEGAQTVRRAMALLRLVATGQELGVRLTDVAQMSGLSRPTAHRLLKVLIDESAVEQDAVTRRYRIGPEMLLLGLARSSGFPIRTVAEPYLRALSQQVGDTVFLSVRHGTDSVCIARHLGHHAIQVLSIEVGVRRPLGASVSGVVLLAAMDPAESRATTQANAARLHQLGLGVAELHRRVQQARQQGHALAERGVVPGTSALAVPVRDAQGAVVAAISIAAMADRLTRKRSAEVLASMQQHALGIAQRLQEMDTSVAAAGV